MTEGFKAIRKNDRNVLVRKKTGIAESPFHKNCFSLQITVISGFADL